MRAPEKVPQGHMFATVVPVVDPADRSTTRRRTMLLDGTASTDPLYRENPDPRVGSDLVFALGDDVLTELGITSDCVFAYRSRNPRDEFYHSVNTLGGPGLHEYMCATGAVDPNGPRVTDSMVVFTDPEDPRGGPRGGVPIDLLLDPQKGAKHGVRIVPTGASTDAELEAVTSFAAMLPASSWGVEAQDPGPKTTLPAEFDTWTADDTLPLRELLSTINGSPSLARGMAAPGKLRTVPLKFRGSRVTSEWVARLCEVLERSHHVKGAAAYVDVVTATLLVATVVVRMHA